LRAFRDIENRAHVFSDVSRNDHRVTEVIINTQANELSQAAVKFFEFERLEFIQNQPMSGCE